MTATVSLERGQPNQRETLANLAQLYIHDFTSFLAPEQKLDVGKDGLFGDEMGLEDYWTQPDQSVWFIRADGRLAGFVMVDRRTRSGEPADFNMAQFFVLRGFRGQDVAGQAVIEMLNRHPGQWEVAIMERNLPALRFWPRAVQRARISSFEMREHVGEAPSRTLLRFVAG